MEKQHPLKFFIDFVELKPLKAWEEEFYEYAIPEFDSPECRKQGYIVALKANIEGGESEYNLYFTDDLANRFLEQKSLSIQAIDMALFEITELENAIIRLITIKGRLQSIIEKLTTYDDVKTYPFILNTCMDLDTHIENHINQISKFKINSTSTDEHPIKIKWLANANVLAQLFFDLLMGQNKQHSFIDIEKPLLEKFIIKHFTDDEGKPFSKHTIEMYMRPDPKGKRTKPYSSFTFPPFKKNKSRT